MLLQGHGKCHIHESLYPYSCPGINAKLTRQFLKEFAPKIAFANPTLPINVERIRDPRSKALNPKSPDAGAGVDWVDGKQPEPEMIVDSGAYLSHHCF